MEKEKRNRGCNFTGEEKELLLALLDKYKCTIENKKTDAASAKEKYEAWENIAREFNSESPNFILRSAESLKKLYANSRRHLKKSVGEEKRQTYLTGGGPPGKPLLTKSDEKLLDIVNKKTIYGMYNTFDGDRNFATESETSEKILEDNITKENKNPEGAIEFVFEDETLLETPRKEVNNEADIQASRTNTWNRYKPDDLKKAKHPLLKRKLEGNNDFKMSRRRPQANRTFTSSILGEKYEELVNKKIELADGLQKEHELRMILLRQEIELRKRKLDYLN